MRGDNEAGRGLLGGLYATLISSICCIIPLLLLILGFGLTVGLVISGFRPYFIIGGIVFIGIYIFVHIRKKSRKCACSTSEMIRREEKFILSTVFTFAIGFLLVNLLVIPLLSSFVLAKGDDINSPDHGRLMGVKLKIDGMTCESCAGIIQEKLLNTKGVVKADISYKDGTGTVIYDPDLISVKQIVERIKPYTATVISEWEVKG